MKKIIFALILLLSISFSAQKIQNKLVDAACGQCLFKIKTEKDCRMFIKVDGKNYPVTGIPEKNYGDAHSNEGYCTLIRKAYVSGEIKNGKFYATSFKYAKN